MNGREQIDFRVRQLQENISLKTNCLPGVAHGLSHIFRESVSRKGLSVAKPSVYQTTGRNTQVMGKEKGRFDYT